jgi:hypothetical protein
MKFDKASTVFLFMVLIVVFGMALTEAKADCDVSTLRKEMITPYKQGLAVESVECKGFTGKGCKRGVMIAQNFLYTVLPLQIKTETFVMLTFDAVTKFPDEPESKRKMLVVRSVDTASCKLDLYDSGDVFRTSLI